MNYRDFYKNNKKRPVSEQAEENLLQGLNLDDPSVDDGLPKRADGSLDTIHDGRPIHLSKIVQIGSEFGKSADGAVSGYSNVGVGEKSSGLDKSKDGEGVHVEKDQEPLTAGGEAVSSEEASKSVGGEVVKGGGQKQGGPNTRGSIAGTPKSGGGETEGDSVLSLQEAKTKLRNMVKEALKEISFNKQTGRWERLTESHDAAGFPTGGTGRPQYKVSNPQYRVADDVPARTRQYEPEITEMYDEEENHAMQERYTELVNASRNLSESELSELRDLGGKLEERNWIQGAVDKSHKGYCTPMTKKTCTPRRKALAQRFKSGDLSENEVNMKMGPSHKTVQDRQYKVSDDDFARTNQYDPKVQENTVDMKMGPSHKRVQPTQAKTAADDFARTNQFDPSVQQEYGAPVIEPGVEPATEPWTEPSPAEPHQPEPQTPDPLHPERPGIEPHPRGEGVMEAGGGAVQHSSYRTANDYPYGKNRHANDIDESVKKKVNEIADNKWTVMHDIAVHCKRYFPTIISEQLRQVIPILFKKETGYSHVDPELLEAIIKQVESGEIKQ